MRKYFCLIALCLMFSISKPLFAQETPRAGTQTTILQSSFTQIGVQAWGAGGAYVGRKGHPTVAFLNPAGLQADNLTVYVESGKRLESDYPFGISLDNQFIIPAFVGINKAAGSFVFSLGYANLYNFNLDVRILATTQLEPDNEEMSHIENRAKVHAFYGALNYKIGKRLSFGVTGILNHLRDEGKRDGELYAKGNGSNFGIIAGGIFDASKVVSFGLSFKYNNKIKYDIETEGISLIERDSLDTRTPIPTEITTTSSAKFPWTLQSGIFFRPTSNFSVSAMFDYQRWSNVNEGRENTTQIHIGADYQLSDATGFSVGFFTMDHSNDEFLQIGQNFLTIGVSQKITKEVELSASVLDAHLLTENDFQQTYIMAGLQYGLK